MIRGTTPYITFTLPFPINQISVGYITFSQNDRIVLDREKSSWVVVDKTATIHLTQAETLEFNDNIPVEVQLAIKMLDGEVLRSKIKRTTAERILKNAEI